MSPRKNSNEEEPNDIMQEVELNINDEGDLMNKDSFLTSSIDDSNKNKNK